VLLRGTGESIVISKEVGIRLGQASEFSLIIVALAATSAANLLGDRANNLIQVTTMLTFIVSCYWVVMSYATPMSLDKKLQME
jgi:hypothetical protein